MQQNGSFIERRNNWIYQAIELNNSLELMEDYLDDMYWFENYIRLIDRSKDTDYYFDLWDEYENLKATYNAESLYASREKVNLLLDYTKLLADAPDFVDMRLLAGDFKIYAKDW